MQEQRSGRKSPSVDLRLKYPKILEGSLVFVLSFLVLIFYSFKKFEPDDGKFIFVTPNVPFVVDDIPEIPDEPKRIKPEQPTTFRAGDAEINDEFPDYIENLFNGEPSSNFDPPPPPEPEPEPEIFQVYQVSQRPEIIKRVIPKYPDMARRGGIYGQVVLKVLIGTTGKIEQVQTVKSIPMLDNAVIAAAWKMEFSPGMQHLRPVRVWMTVPFNFQLNR